MPLISPRAFKTLARKGESAPSDTRLRKELVLPTERVGDRRLRFTISTAMPDRESDVVMQDGWDLAAFLANPVVLYGHDQHDYPIGRALDVAVEGGALKATVEFVPAGVPLAGPRAEAVYQLCLGGYLAATSVGFRPLNWNVPQGESARGDEWWPGVDYLRCELVEFSVVAVPCNPESLIEPGQLVVLPSPEPLVEQPLAVVATFDPAKAEAAAIFKAKWDEVKADTDYQRMKREFEAQHDS